VAGRVGWGWPKTDFLAFSKTIQFSSSVLLAKYQIEVLLDALKRKKSPMLINRAGFFDKRDLSGSHTVSTTRHFTASFGAPATGFGTGFAMRMFVLSALLGAGFAQVSTELTHISCVFTVTGHEGYGHVAHFGAVAVEPDAGNHHFYILLTQAGFGAGIAAYGTILTGINAILVLLRG
jgi:hypothetical protein